MTNEEKASKLAVVLADPNDQILTYANFKSLLLEMAEWKDQQHAKECESLVGLAVKEARQVFIDKACEWIRERNSYACDEWLDKECEDFRKAMTKEE